MNKLLASPLLTTMCVACLFSLCFLGLPYLLPLPGDGVRTFSQKNDENRKSTGPQGSLKYDVALDSPLFHENRSKPVKEVIVVAPVEVKRIEAPYQLAGIMGAADNSRSAYLQHKDTGETLMVRVGDTAGNWRVDTIGQDFIALLNGSERRVIQLAGGG